MSRCCSRPRIAAAGVPARELQKARESGRAAEERFHVRKDGPAFSCSGDRRSTRARRSASPRSPAISRASTQAAEALRVVQAEFDQRDPRAHRRARGRGQRARRGAPPRHGCSCSASSPHRKTNAPASPADLHDQLGQQLTALRLTLQRHRDRLAVRVIADRAVVSALSLAQRDRSTTSISWPGSSGLRRSTTMASRRRCRVFVREWSEHYGIPVNTARSRLVAGPARPRCRGRLLPRRAGGAQQRRSNTRMPAGWTCCWNSGTGRSVMVDRGRRRRLRLDREGRHPRQGHRHRRHARARRA